MIMRLKTIIKMYERGNVCVYGRKGSGKDLLQSNVVIRRNLPYIANIDYGGKYIPLEINKLDCGKNTYKNFISGKIRRYIYPYADHTDVYISDAGVYFPAQYNSELNRDFGYMATFSALNRQIGEASLHFNVQHLPRVWDKFREQSEQYIYCQWCIYLFGLVIQKVRLYEDYESARQKRRPFAIKAPLMAKKELKLNIEMQRLNYEALYGVIKQGILVYRNKSTYDTRRFKQILEEGEEP